jgi:predicted dehydrogenase
MMPDQSQGNSHRPRPDKPAGKVVLIGGFGHWQQVLEELDQPPAGVAPAGPGESLPAGIPFFADYRQMLASVQPSIAIVSCRLDRIPSIAMEVARHGCDLICEKPLALDPATLALFHDTVRQTGVRLLPMLNMRGDPVFQTARRLYGEGLIGEVVLVNTRKSYKYGQRPEWFGERAKYGGTMLWVGIHALDLIHFITGQTFRSVAARHRNFAHPQRPDCEDSLAGILELANGATATISVDLLRPNVAPTHGDDWIRVVGTQGIIEARSNDGVVQLLTETDGARVIPPDPVQSLYRPFVAGKDTLATGEVGFLLTQACLCAREAADTGRLQWITGPAGPVAP